MVTILQFLIQSIPIFISIIIPGFLLALALLRKTNLHLFEIFFVGIVFGMVVPALMAFVEFLVGIPFSFTLHLINLVIISILSIGIIIKDKIGILPRSKLNIKILYAFLILIIILFLAWWIRIQSLNPFFYEFDPYWYNTITEFIIKLGYVPLHSDNAWWPQTYSYRGTVVMPYIEAGWYHIYTYFNGITQFDFTEMTLVSSLYPPIAAALMCFFAYLWFSKEYGKAFGILAAGLLAFTPILIDKTLAGEFEVQPWGLFCIVFFFAFYTLALKTNSKRFALVVVLAIIIGSLGSSVGRILIYLFILVSSILAIIKFFKNELKLDFIYVNAIITSGIFIVWALTNLYTVTLVGISSLSILAAGICFIIFMFILFYLQSASKLVEEKIIYLSSIIILGLILLFITPLGGVLSEISSLFSGVVSYTDPTFQTIAEQIVTGSSLHSALGIFGYDFSNFSIVVIVIIISAIPILFFVVFESGIYSLIGLLCVLPLSLTGLFKLKYIPYSGLFVPLLVCFAIGEVYKNKNVGKYRKYILVFAAILLFIQAVSYYDVITASIGIVGKVDITSTAAVSEVCNKNYQEMVSITNNMSLPIKEAVLNAKSVTQRVYCNIIPDHWLNAMNWIKENRKGEERVFSWWDYGHWTTTFGQGKSVTDNTHSYTLMHQEVADKLVYNSPEALIQYMKEHKAKYVLLDEDLIGKWGALVYHACYYNNKTTIAIGPGNSECDRGYSPEFVFVPLPDASTSQMSSENLCDIKIDGNRGIKVYSPYFGKQNQFGYYCTSISSLNQGLSLLQYGTSYVPLSFTYENGKKAGITNGLFQGRSSDGNYLIFLVTYPSDSPDRKGKFYDSVFYKGFFEGKIPGFEQVHPEQNLLGPVIPVRIYKLNG